MTADPAIVKWKGPERWRGRALSDYDRFAFHELPWKMLRVEDEERDGIRCIKSSNSRRVFRIALPSEPDKPVRVVYAKRYRINTLRRGFAVRLLGSKAGHEFRLGHDLLDAGISTPLPLAWAEHFLTSVCRLGEETARLPPASYLLTLEWPNAGSVADWLKLHPQSQARLIPPLAAFLASSHRRGFYHDDCAADHVLVSDSARFEEDVDPSTSFGFIDLDNGRLGVRPVSIRGRLSNLFQILRSLTPELLPVQQRIALIEAYREFWADSRAPEIGDCISRIEHIAERKVGRRVVHC
jgi:hypothetical protein